MFYKIFIIHITILLLFGCGHPDFYLNEPPVVDDNDRILITVYRDKIRPGVLHWIGLNGNLIAKLGAGEYTEFYISASENNTVSNMCTKPTHDFDNYFEQIYTNSTGSYIADKYVQYIAKENKRGRINKIDPVSWYEQSTCFLSTSSKQLNDDICDYMKLKRQNKEACQEKRKQLSFVKPGRDESS